MGKKWKSLSFRLPAYLLLAALLPITFFGLYAIELNKSTLLEAQRRGTRQVAFAAAKLVEANLAGIARELQNASKNLQLSPSMKPGDIELALLSMQSQLRMIRELSLIDTKGQDLAKTVADRVALPRELFNRADQPFFRAVMAGNLFIGEPLLDELATSSGYLNQIGLPLFDPASQAVVAVLLADISLTASLAEITDLRIGQKGAVYVVDAEGRIIVHSDADLIATRARLSLSRMQNLATSDGDATSYRYYNARGIDVQGSMVPINGTRWFVVGEREITDIYIDIDMKKIKYLLPFSLAGLLLLVVSMIFVFRRRTIAPLVALEAAAIDICSGRSPGLLTLRSEDEVSRIAEAFNVMTAQMIAATDEQQKLTWQLRGLANLNVELLGIPSLAEMSCKAVSQIAHFVEVPVAAIYINNGSDVFRLMGSYGLEIDTGKPNEFALRQGLVGQVAIERCVLEVNDVPADYLRVTSGLGGSDTQYLMLFPLIYLDVVVGVVELGAFGPFSPRSKEFLNMVADPLAFAIEAANAREVLRLEVINRQRFAEELQTQQEELQAANEELEEQAQRLQASEEELKAQQEDLQATNEELEENTLFLQQQKDLITEKNQMLEQTQSSLEQQARELQMTSKYKSEFLANMSHELRTPLNSLLILSQDLASNREGNLLDGQVESAEVIYNSGNDLLRLINEILDLSKIEAGKMELHLDEVDLKAFRTRLERSFQHMAQARSLDFAVTVEADAPAALRTDPQRLDQIVKNLVSNALKFTSFGSVQIRLGLPRPDVVLRRFGLEAAQCFALAVTDTGTGIPEDKLEEIFGAFQQVDGSISRQYGGTGLGLTISRELASLLGGELRVESQLGVGSTFTLYLPLASPAVSAVPEARPLTNVSPKPATQPAPQATRGERPVAPSIDDDRAQLAEDERVILIVEDDLKFARILAGLCHDKGFRFLHAGDGESGLQLARDYQPTAILLDIRLPGMHGLELLDTLKRSTSLRHIPVHMISVEDRSHEALQLGAVGFLSKPASREQLGQAFARIEEVVSGRLRKLLVVEDNAEQRKSIVALIGNGDVVSIEAETGQQALELLQQGDIDCMILDLKLPDMTGFELLKQLEKQDDLSLPPVIIYTGRDLSCEEEAALREYTASIIIKGVRSPERLLDETSLFLHRVVGKLPLHKQQMIAALHDGETQLDGRKILLVDDDMRNVFALARVLEAQGVTVIKATDGEKALAALEREPDIDLVLMDIMMPVMDGYEAMRRIRKQARFAKLPILALTAKAMPEDRGKCIEAGANDYLTKPVDVPKLLSLLRVWLYR